MMIGEDSWTSDFFNSHLGVVVFALCNHIRIHLHTTNSTAFPWETLGIILRLHSVLKCIPP